MSEERNDLGRLVEDAVYTAVGFAVLGVQRAQVARRRLERSPAGAAASSCLRGLLDRLTGTPGGGDGASGRR